MGRLRKFQSNAERQAAYEQRKRLRIAESKAVATHAQEVIDVAKTRGVVEPTATDAEALKAVASLLSGKGELVGTLWRKP